MRWHGPAGRGRLPVAWPRTASAMIPLVVHALRPRQVWVRGLIRHIVSGAYDSKSDKVYHLVGNLLKMPFWDRVQKNRVLSGFIQKKMDRVARSGAGWDPIALPACEPIGITSY